MYLWTWRGRVPGVGFVVERHCGGRWDGEICVGDEVMSGGGLDLVMGIADLERRRDVRAWKCVMVLGDEVGQH